MRFSLMPLAVLLTWPAAANTGEVVVSVTNGTSREIGAIYVSAAGQESFDDEILSRVLVADEVLAPGDAAVVSGVSGIVDVLVVSAEGDALLTLYNVRFEDGADIRLLD